MFIDGLQTDGLLTNYKKLVKRFTNGLLMVSVINIYT